MRHSRVRVWLRKWEEYTHNAFYLVTKRLKNTRALVEKAVASWHYLSDYRCWRQRAVVFCLQRHHTLLLQTIVTVWEDQRADFAAVVYKVRKIRRIKLSFAVAFWRQYAQEQRLSKQTSSPIHLSRMLASYCHMEPHTGVSRVRSFGYYSRCAYNTYAFAEAHLSAWLCWCVIVRRIRTHLTQSERLVTRRRNASALCTVWVAMCRGTTVDPQINGGTRKVSYATHVNKWADVTRIIGVSRYAPHHTLKESLRCWGTYFCEGYVVCFANVSLS